MTLIESIKAARLARGWTQAQLAEASGVAQSDISAAETGRRPPGIKVMDKLVKALGLEITIK